MASLPLEGPKQFDFSSPDDRPKWIRRFERFREASGLSSKPDERQVNTLIYSMGDKADDILNCSIPYAYFVPYAYGMYTIRVRYDFPYHTRTV